MEKRESYFINEIKDRVTRYELEKVNCFERPQSIAIGKYGMEYTRFFLMYMKLLQAYKINVSSCEENQDAYMQDILLEQLGIKAIGQKISGNLISSIEEIIDKGIPVLVPINLKKLYYSEHYEVNDWQHLLLIKGYDNKKGIFKILDGVQCHYDNDLQYYNDFTIRFNDLEECFLAYSNFGDLKIYYYLKYKELKKKECLLYFLNKLKTAIDNRSFMQLEIMGEIKDSILDYKSGRKDVEAKEKKKMSSFFSRGDVQSLIRHFTNNSKYKLVILTELIYLLKEYSYSYESLHELENTGMRLNTKWSKYSLHLIKLLHSNSTKFMEADISINDEILEEEKHLSQCINDIIAYLSDYVPKSTDMPVLKGDDYKLENNKDGLIRKREEKILFEFKTNKLYNTWIADNCPKVVFDYNNYKLFKSKVKVIFESGQIGFQAGLFIKDSKGNLYSWAVDHLNNLILDFVGKKTLKCLSNKWDFHEELELYVKFNNRQIEFGIIEEKELMSKGSLDRGEEILKLGLFCKNWDSCLELCVEFFDFSWC